DRGLIAIDKDLPSRLEQKDGVRTALEQQAKHRLRVRLRRGPFVPFTVGLLWLIHAGMKNELTFLPWTSETHLLANGATGQARRIRSGGGPACGRPRRSWQLRPTPQYLRALQEAEQAVTKAVLRGVRLRHTAQLDRP